MLKFCFFKQLLLIEHGISEAPAEEIKLTQPPTINDTTPKIEMPTIVSKKSATLAGGINSLEEFGKFTLVFFLFSLSLSLSLSLPIIIPYEVI